MFSKVEKINVEFGKSNVLGIIKVPFSTTFSKNVDRNYNELNYLLLLELDSFAFISGSEFVIDL